MTALRRASRSRTRRARASRHRRRCSTALLGSLSFDPLAFARASDREQVEQLAGLCGVDMAAVEREHKGDYERRRDCNRDAKQKRAAAGQIEVPADTPDAEISVGALVKQIRDAEAGNRERESERVTA